MTFLHLLSTSEVSEKEEMGTMKTMKAIHKVCKWKTKENERQFYHKHFENKLWEILKQRKHLPYIV